MSKKGRDNWFELFGITVQIRTWQNGYIVTRSDMPDKCYMDKNGKPFATRDKAKDFIDCLYNRLYDEHLDEFMRRTLQPPVIHVTKEAFNKLNSKL